MKKAYCRDCKYLNYDTPFIGAKCRCENIISIDSWLERIQVKDTRRPWKKNANNDCKYWCKK